MSIVSVLKKLDYQQNINNFTFVFIQFTASDYWVSAVWYKDLISYISSVRDFAIDVVMLINSLRPSEAYIRQLSNPP